MVPGFELTTFGTRVSSHNHKTCLTFFYTNFSSGDNYFNALRRLDFRLLKFKMSGEEEFREFLSTHLVAATREVRPDIVRLLFQQVKAFARVRSIMVGNIYFFKWAKPGLFLFIFVLFT